MRICYDASRRILATMLRQRKIVCLMLAIPAACCSLTIPQESLDDTGDQICVTAPSPRANIVEWNFAGDPLSPIEQKQVVTSLRARDYGGATEEIADGLEEPARRALQNLGYFTPRVEPEVRILTSGPASARVAITLQIFPGPKYYLGRVTFKNNRAISNVRALRTVFRMKNGDLFSAKEIERGLEALRQLYRNLGFINFTAVPNTEVHPESQTIDVLVDIDEGKQFFISTLDVIGLDPARAEVVLHETSQKSGDVYNDHLLILTLEQHAGWLPHGIPPELLIRRRLDERQGTIAVTLDFRTRPSSCATFTAAGVKP